MNAHEEIEIWHQQRVARLASREGWLAITGRWELDGEPVELPIGLAQAEADGVRIGGTFHRFGSSFEEGPRLWEVTRVGDLRIVRVRDPESPALKSFRGVDRFPVDLKYRVTAQVVAAEHGAQHVYASGATITKASPGRLVFAIDGVTFSLGTTWEGTDRLFVLFADATNEESTYGAGRFLYVPYDGGGTATIDFNQAFNPPCALTEFASCPIVPDEDRLPIAIPAGERYPLPA